MRFKIKIKSILLILLFLVTSFTSYAQLNNQFRVYYGFADTQLIRSEELACGGSFDNHNSYEFGIHFLRKFSKRFSIETGFNLFSSQVKITPSFTGTPVQSRTEELIMVSIPVYANYSLGKYFFVNGGPVFHFQYQEKSFDTQSGIGYEIGIGGKYNFNNYVIYINPNFKQHSFIPFHKKQYYQKLTQFGIQIGIGYNF